MIRMGLYAQYNGYDYRLSGDMKGNTVIITKDKELTDDTFEDAYHSGVYTKVIEESQLDAVYRVTTYALVEGQKVLVIRENKNGYDIGGLDSETSRKLNFKMVDKGVYEGWISKEAVLPFEEIEVLKGSLN